MAKNAKTPRFWVVLAVPGMLWPLVLFIVPVYAVLAIAMGKLDQMLKAPVAIWNPFDWSSSNVIDVWRDLFGSASFAGPIATRTIAYTAIAALLCLLNGYPCAYFVARFAGRRKGLFLVLLIAPFWISYMMRMLAWIDLLATGGYVNKAARRQRQPGAERARLHHAGDVAGHRHPGLRRLSVAEPW